MPVALLLVLVIDVRELRESEDEAARDGEARTAGATVEDLSTQALDQQHVEQQANEARRGKCKTVGQHQMHERGPFQQALE